MNKKIAYPLILVLCIVVAIVVILYAPTKAPSAVHDAPATSDARLPSGAQTYRIQSAASTAEFQLDETLQGKSKTVIGRTHAVAGVILFNPSDIRSTRFLEPFTVNARTFQTDTASRDHAIRRFILRTENDANEFIVFVPERLADAPVSLAVGQTVSFTLAGNLTVSGTTKPVSFLVTLARPSETKLTGTAKATIFYEDFGVHVPDFPFLANVEKSLDLSIVFTAAG